MYVSCVAVVRRTTCLPRVPVCMYEQSRSGARWGLAELAETALRAFSGYRRVVFDELDKGKGTGGGRKRNGWHQHLPTKNNVNLTPNMLFSKQKECPIIMLLIRRWLAPKPSQAKRRVRHHAEGRGRHCFSMSTYLVYVGQSYIYF